MRFASDVAVNFGHHGNEAEDGSSRAASERAVCLGCCCVDAAAEAVATAAGCERAVAGRLLLSSVEGTPGAWPRRVYLHQMRRCHRAARNVAR